MSSDFDRAAQLVELLDAASITATMDPRSATPPCVLVTPPNFEDDLACGETAEWHLWILAPTTANADAWKALGDLRVAVRDTIGYRRADFASYSLSPDTPPLPAYHVTFSEGID